MNKLQELQQKLKAPKSLYNSFGGYAYRSAESILEALKPLLAETNTYILISDELCNIGERYYIKAVVNLHDAENDGLIAQTVAYAREEETKKGMDGSQITGASSSYARKYALNGMFLIDDMKDSDATNTHDKEEPKAKSSVAKVACPVCGKQTLQSAIDAFGMCSSCKAKQAKGGN